MPLLSFFLRRFLTGAAARVVTKQLTKRFNMSPGVANLVFAVLTEVIARQSERIMPPAGPASAGGAKSAPRSGRGWKPFGKR